MAETTRTLIVMPDHGLQPLLDAIKCAKQTLNIKMFALSEPRLIEEVIAAHRRGVPTRVMLNPSRRSGYSDNERARETFSAAGISVRETHHEFEVTHEKTVVADTTMALIQSFNWTPENLEKRDYAIRTTVPAEITEMQTCFNADWDRTDFEQPADSPLIWCRGGGRKKICDFIDRARKSLWIQNERYDDMTVIEHLLRAMRRGVKVRLLARLPHHLRPKKLLSGVASLRIMQDLGASIHHMNEFHLHAKIMLADKQEAVVGSINFSSGSFDDRRELAIVVRDKPVIRQLRNVFKHDWKHSQPIDLSDDGIVREISRHQGDELVEVFLKREMPRGNNAS